MPTSDVRVTSPVGGSVFRRLASLWRRKDGATAVEFALIAPAFIVLLFGIFEFSLLLLAHVTLESSIRQAAREGMTGYNEDCNRFNRILTILQDGTVGLLDIDASDIELLQYASFEQVGTGDSFTDVDGDGAYDPSVDTFDPGTQDTDGDGIFDADHGVSMVLPGSPPTLNDGPLEIILYRVQAEYDPMTPLFFIDLLGGVVGANLLNSDGKIDLDASMPVRNEPWTVGSTLTTCVPPP